MSELKKLLQGVEVEWKALGKVANILRGRRLTKKQLSINDVYPVFHGGLEPLGHYSKSNRPADSVMIINVGASAGTVGYSNVNFWSSDGCYTVEKSLTLNNKFLYYYLISEEYYLKSKVRYAGIPTLDAFILENLQIPIPCPDQPAKSLKIQEEIVRVLDSLSEETNKLTTALQNELDNHQKRYEYYREELFKFEGKEVEWKSLGEVAKYSKNRCKILDLNESNYVGVDNLLQNKAGKINSKHLPKEGNFTEYSENDILIGNIRPYLKKIWFANCKGGTNGDVLVIRKKSNLISSSYLFQVLADDVFFSYQMKFAKGAKMPRGDKKKTMDFKIPIPFPTDLKKSLKEQERIVKILDKLDTTTQSITTEIKKEIELRNKQYEYYRDALLTFPKEVSQIAEPVTP